MSKLYILCGIAFSGKSTLARKISEHFDCKLIAFDQLWVETEKNSTVSKNAEGWRMIRDLAQEQIFSTLKSGTSVVYDDNNPKKEHRQELREVAIRAGVGSVVIYLDTPIEVVRTREQNNFISQDRHEVETENFDKVLQDLEPPTIEENMRIFRPGDDLSEFLQTL